MKIEKARLEAMSKMPYMSSAIYGLRVIETERFDGVAAVTKHGWMIINPKEFNNLSDEAAGTVVLHEAMHLINEHFDRSVEFAVTDNVRWNYAADLEINDDLVSAGCVIPNFNNGGTILLPNQFGFNYGELAETYYGLLAQFALKHICCGSGSGNPLDGEDDLVPSGGEAIKKEELERIKREVASSVDEYSKKGGFVPGNLRRFASNQLKEDPIDWRKQLAKYVRHHITVSSGMLNQTYNKISRRQHLVPNIILPSYIAYTPKIGVLIDTSGSMSEKELGSGLFQIKNLLRTFNSDVWLCVVDATIHSLGKVKRIKDIEAKLVGGGGTVFTEAIPRMDELKCSCIIGISDCEASYPEKCETPFVWVTHNKHANPPFGKVVLIEEGK